MNEKQTKPIRVPPQVVALDHKKEIMTAAYLIAIGVAVAYALIRAKHDSYLSHGKWKHWAFAEGVFLALIVVLGLHAIYDINWAQTALLGPVIAVSFSIVFDGMCGVLRVGKWFYLGSKGFDAWVNAVVKGKVWAYFLFKLFWLFMFSAWYFNLIF